MTRNKNHNDIQEAIHCISGYSAYEDFTSAKDDYFYDLIEKKDKINQACAYGLTENEAIKVIEFLEKTFDCLGSRDYCFLNIE
jgi:hypothetical protein